MKKIIRSIKDRTIRPARCSFRLRQSNSQGDYRQKLCWLWEIRIRECFSFSLTEGRQGLHVVFRTHEFFLKDLSIHFITGWVRWCHIFLIPCDLIERGSLYVVFVCLVVIQLKMYNFLLLYWNFYLEVMAIFVRVFSASRSSRLIFILWAFLLLNLLWKVVTGFCGRMYVYHFNEFIA